MPDDGSFSTPQFSLAIWFQTQSNILQNLVGKRDFANPVGSGGAQYQFFINYPPFPGIGSNIVDNISTCSNINSSSYVNTGNIICSNKWYFAVITFDGSWHKIYIDGVLVRNVPTTFNGMAACNSDLRFGNWWSLDLIPFNGRLDDIRWYNRPINQQEVDALFNNFSSTTSPVEFTFSQNACDPLKVNFTNNTSGIQNSTWYFGDGNTSIQNSPIYNYIVAGIYNVKLITTNIYGCTDSVLKSVAVNISQADIIILSVKPQDFPVVGKQIAPYVQQEQLILSIMAGIKISSIYEAIGATKIVRAMPNLPAQIGMGMTVFTSSTDIDKKELFIMLNLINTTGKSVYVEDESKIDAATAISGSGPAYVYYFMEAMIQAGVKMGFSLSQAELLVNQTFMGAVHLHNQSDLTCEEWITRVASKGGTTEAALKVLTENTVEPNIEAALFAAFNRAKELGN